MSPDKILGRDQISGQKQRLHASLGQKQVLVGSKFQVRNKDYILGSEANEGSKASFGSRDDFGLGANWVGSIFWVGSKLWGLR